MTPARSPDEGYLLDNREAHAGARLVVEDADPGLQQLLCPDGCLGRRA